MVGVSGRSKGTPTSLPCKFCLGDCSVVPKTDRLCTGCRTCRRRRVKCDEQQPLCVRCEKGGFDCEGFGRDLSFVNENSRAQRRSLQQAAMRARVIEIESDTKSCVKLVIAPKAASIDATRLWPELNYSAFKDNISISFTLARLFAWDARSIEWLGWGYNAAEASINSHALKALSSVYYGRINHESSFENDGRVHYSRTLRGLRNLIESPKRTSLDVLIAGMTASCYEMVSSLSHKETLLHAGGVGMLIELRGPKRHRGMFELQILSTMRTSICMKAMIDRKRCFLQRDDWKTIPWSLCPAGKSMVARVQDIMCNVPGLFEDFDSLLAPSTCPETYTFQLRFESLAANIKHHLLLLSDWRVQWEQNYPGICHEQTSYYPESPFPTALHYQDLEAVNGLMLYDALYINIAELGMSLLGPDFDYRQPSMVTKFACTNLQLNPPGASLYDTAIEICRSLQYHLSPPHENAGAFFTIFPLYKANNQLPIGSPEHQWLKSMMVDLVERTGFIFSTGVFFG